MPFEVFRLYIDLVVDKIPFLFGDVFDFTPIDEPLLELAFSEERYRHVHWQGVDLKVVEPSLLLGMKLNSVDTRTRDHKGLKDIADMYALAWHSGESLADLKEEIVLFMPVDRLKTVLRGISRDDFSDISNMLGVEARSISRVFAGLVL